RRRQPQQALELIEKQQFPLLGQRLYTIQRLTKLVVRALAGHKTLVGKRRLAQAQKWYEPRLHERRLARRGWPRQRHEPVTLQCLAQLAARILATEEALNIGLTTGYV